MPVNCVSACPSGAGQIHPQLLHLLDRQSSRKLGSVWHAILQIIPHLDATWNQSRITHIVASADYKQYTDDIMVSVLQRHIGSAKSSVASTQSKSHKPGCYGYNIKFTSCLTRDYCPVKKVFKYSENIYIFPHVHKFILGGNLYHTSLHSELSYIAGIPS